MASITMPIVKAATVPDIPATPALADSTLLFNSSTLELRAEIDLEIVASSGISGME